jgi:hypothetical protein
VNIASTSGGQCIPLEVFEPFPVIASSSSKTVTAELLLELVNLNGSFASSLSAVVREVSRVMTGLMSARSSMAIPVVELLNRPRAIMMSASGVLPINRQRFQPFPSCLSGSDSQAFLEPVGSGAPPVYPQSSSAASANIEISFEILTAFYPVGNSSTFANAVFRTLTAYTGGVINTSATEVVVISNIPGEVVVSNTGNSIGVGESGPDDA